MSKHAAKARISSKPRISGATTARQNRTIKALLVFSLLLFVSMIGLIRYLKHNQEIAAQQAILCDGRGASDRA